MSDWYLQGEDGAPTTPMTTEQVRQALAAGRVTGETLVWTKGQAEWGPISSVPEFRAATPAAVRPAPASPALPSSPLPSPASATPEVASPALAMAAASPPATAGIASRSGVGAPDDGRYRNLVRVIGSLNMYGGLLQVGGLLVGLGGMVAAVTVDKGGVVIALVGVCAGMSLFAFGSVVAAMGEGLLALRDIAVSTRQMAASGSSRSASEISGSTEVAAPAGTSATWRADEPVAKLSADGQVAELDASKLSVEASVAALRSLVVDRKIPKIAVHVGASKQTEAISHACAQAGFSVSNVEWRVPAWYERELF